MVTNRRDPFDVESKPLTISLDVAVPEQFPSPLVPKKTRMPGMTSIVALLVVSLTTLGIGSLQTIFSDIGYQFISYLFGSTGLPVFLSNIFVGVICLSLAVIFLYWMGKWDAIVPAIKESTQVILNREPKEYFALNHVESKYLFRELRDRGCTISTGLSGKGWNIDCPTIPLTKSAQELIRGVDFKYNNRYKVAQIGIFNLIAAIFIFFYCNGSMEPIYGKYVILIIFVFMIYCQIGMHAIGWWGGVILYWIYIVAIWVFAPFTETIFIYSLVAVGIIFILLVSVGALVRPNICLNSDVWWCPYYA